MVVLEVSKDKTFTVDYAPIARIDAKGTFHMHEYRFLPSGDDTYALGNDAGDEISFPVENLSPDRSAALCLMKNVRAIHGRVYRGLWESVKFFTENVETVPTLKKGQNYFIVRRPLDSVLEVREGSMTYRHYFMDGRYFEIYCEQVHDVRGKLLDNLRAALEFTSKSIEEEKVS